MGLAFDNLFAGFVYLATMDRAMWLEADYIRHDGTRGTSGATNCLAPAHPMLPNVATQQQLAIVMAIANKRVDGTRRYGDSAPLPQAVQQAEDTLHANTGGKPKVSLL